MKAAALSLLASVLLVAPAAFAQNQSKTKAETSQRPRAEQMVNRRVDRLALVLNLTPEQKTQAHAYFMNAWEANKDALKQLRSDRMTLDSDVKAKADQAKLMADADAVGRDQAKIIANNATAQEKFLSTLSAQEQAKYEKLEGARIGGLGWGGMAPGIFYR